MTELENKNLHKEIDLIQDCIKRMASNSFLLKGWAISLVTVVLALSAKQVNPYFLGFVVLVPLVTFWYLDAFFLFTEKMYREMYNWVIQGRPEGNTKKLYDLNPHRFKDQLKVKNKKKPQEEWKQESEWTVMWSKTLRCFYLTPICLVTLSLLVYFLTQDFSKLTSTKVPKQVQSWPQKELVTKNDQVDQIKVEAPKSLPTDKATGKQVKPILK